MAAAIHINRPPVQYEPVGIRRAQVCDRIITNLALPILASLASFLILPFEGALLLTCAVAVVSVAIYSSRENPRRELDEVRRNGAPAVVVVQQRPAPPPPLIIPDSPFHVPRLALQSRRRFWESPLSREYQSRPDHELADLYRQHSDGFHELVGRRENPRPAPAPVWQAPQPCPLPVADQPPREPVGRREPQLRPVPVAVQPPREPVGRREPQLQPVSAASQQPREQVGVGRRRT